MPDTTTPDPWLVVPPRFRGPSSSGNGGWTSGALAEFLPGAPAVTVRLFAPPPLATPMAVEMSRADDGSGRRVAVARAAGTVVLQASEVEDDLEALDVVDVETARAAQARYGGLADHPFPECFSCGTGRRAGDGLALRPGRVAQDGDDGDGGAGGDPGDCVIVATTWTPAPEQAGDDAVRVPAPIAWAALDCPGGWSVDISGRPMVLGTMTAALGRLPRVGEECVVVGRCEKVSGRKALTTSTLRGDGGEVLGRARAVWIAVDPSSVQPR